MLYTVTFIILNTPTLFYGYRTKILAAIARSGLEVPDFSYSTLGLLPFCCEDLLTTPGTVILVVAETEFSTIPERMNGR